jgi:hypothetical protein
MEQEEKVKKEQEAQNRRFRWLEAMLKTTTKEEEQEEKVEGEKSERIDYCALLLERLLEEEKLPNKLLSKV